MEEPPVIPSGVVEPSPEPPRDRGIWVVANLIDRDELGSAVEGYEGYAKYSQASGDWLNHDGLSIRQYLHSEFRILSWMECADRARNCPEHEIVTNTGVWYYDSEVARETGSVGFRADMQLYHKPTWTKIRQREEGPFATRGEALAALSRFLAEPIWPDQSPA